MTELANECTVSFALEPNYEYPRALFDISATVSHPAHGEVASATAVRFNRVLLRGQVHEVLDGEHAELGEMATTLMDPSGNFRPWLIKPGFRAGSGVWGRELNKGWLLYIFNVTVNDEFRGQGIGSWTIQQLCKQQIGHYDFAICWPVPLIDARNNRDEWIHVRDRQVNFIHQNGFRRIGRTGFFGYAPVPNHPSRLLPPNEDAEPAAEWTPPTSGSGSGEDTSDIAERFPLHGLIACSTLLPAAHGDAILDTQLRAVHASDPASLSAAGLDGELPLHVAAKAGSVVATRTLLELGVAANGDLENRANRDGTTPLEACEDQMLKDREFGAMIFGGGMFAGMPAQVQTKNDERKRGFQLVAKMLKEAMGEDITETDEEWLARRKHGCTCGECTGGWLSWRMRYRLQLEAATKAGIMADDIRFGNYQSYRPFDEDEVDMISELEYIPPHLRQKVYKTFALGYASMFRIIASAFDHPRVNTYFASEGVTPPGGFDDPVRTMDIYLANGGIPDTAHCRGDDNGRGLDYFLDKCGGGRDAKMYALDCLTRETAQGDLPDVLVEDEALGLWEALPTCGNDDDFELVRKQLGLAPERMWGPYQARDEDEDEEMDSDDY